MKRYAILTTVFISFVLTACTPYYLSSNFESRTVDHKTIAVLPFEMIYTGVRPNGLTDQDMREIAMAESQAFQISFYNEILRSTRSGKKPIRVNLQDYRKTWQILEENRVTITESWNNSPESLASLLGVDAVVRARVEKNRLMSDLQSYGIDVAVHILNVITDHAMWPWLPFGVTNSKRIRASYSLMDRQDGEVLWSVAINVDADWRQRANDIIDDINRRGARKFPYRIGRSQISMPGNIIQ